MLAQQGHGLAAVLRLHRAVAVAREGLRHDRADALFIVDHENQLVVPLHQLDLGRRGLREHRVRLVNRGNGEREPRPHPLFTVRPQRAPVAARDRETAREAQTRSVCGVLGREERFEDATLHLGRHAQSGVFDRDGHIAARVEHRRLVGARCDVLDLHRDAQPAAVGHGVSSVGDEVDEHLHDLGRIAPQGRHVSVLDLDVDRLRQHREREGGELVDEPVGVHGVSSALDAASERQHLADHVRPPGDRRLHGVEQLGLLACGVHRAQELHRHEHWRQHVVEVVGDSAGERAEALEPPCATLLLLLLTQRRDIRVDREVARRSPLVIDDGLPTARDDDAPAVFRALLQFARPPARGREGRRGFIEPRRVVVDEVANVAADGLFSRPAVDLLGAAVPIGDVVLEVFGDEGLVRDVEQRAQAHRTAGRLIEFAPLALEVRDVAQVHGDSVDRGVAAGLEPEIEGRVIRAHVGDLAVLHGPTQRLAEVALGRVSRKKVTELLADDLVGRQPEVLLCGPIEIGVPPLPIEEDQPIGDLIERRIDTRVDAAAVIGGVTLRGSGHGGHPSRCHQRRRQTGFAHGGTSP